MSCSCCGKEIDPETKQPEDDPDLCFRCSMRSVAEGSLLASLEMTIEVLNALADVERMYAGEENPIQAEETDRVRRHFEHRLATLREVISLKPQST